MTTITRDKACVECESECEQCRPMTRGEIKLFIVELYDRCRLSNAEVKELLILAMNRCVDDDIRSRIGEVMSRL